MRIVCISDTHGLALPIPEGDLLLHAGDLTGSGKLAQVHACARWLRGLPHPVKVVIAGNHDFAFERQPELARAALHDPASGIFYLQDTGAILPGGLKIYGSPWQPRFCDFAFNLDRGAPLEEKWRLIPDDVAILLTHGPPHGILDQNIGGAHVGCEALMRRIEQLHQLKLHVFGHIHEARGMMKRGAVTHVNASVLDANYREWDEPPLVVDWAEI